MNKKQTLELLLALECLACSLTTYHHSGGIITPEEQAKNADAEKLRRLCHKMREEIKKTPSQQCEGCEHEPTEPHTCPYKEDVNSDSETLCTCCEECQTQCAQDI